MEHYVYVIGEECDVTFDIFSGYMKVGITNNPHSRMKHLQCSNPRRLSFLCILAFDTKFHAEVVEKGLHSLMENNQTINEWFVFNKYTHKWLERIRNMGVKNVTERFIK